MWQPESVVRMTVNSCRGPWLWRECCTKPWAQRTLRNWGCAVFRLEIHEPPYGDPHVRWSERTEGMPPILPNAENGLHPVKHRKREKGADYILARIHDFRDSEIDAQAGQ